MALSLEGGTAVWNRARQVLAGQNAATARILLRELKGYLATLKGNPKLQFAFIDGTVSSSDGGASASNVLFDSPCTLHALFLNKVGSTKTIFKGSDNATTAATDGTQAIALTKTKAGNLLLLYPDGREFTAGLTVTENTTETGSTLTLKANRFDGFAVIAADDTSV